MPADGTGAVPGGVNKSLNAEEIAYLTKDIDQIVAWAQEAVELIKREMGQVDLVLYSLASPRRQDPARPVRGEPVAQRSREQVAEQRSDEQQAAFLMILDSIMRR